jgi:2,3-bisphosphoglycerate-independent phosphoglycerate mutase
MLVILDGFGWREPAEDNAVALARTPNFDRLWQTGPRAFLDTSGDDVGLPDGQMGNSEVGHLNIGAGRIVPQELARIGRAIADGSLARSPVLLEMIRAAQTSGGICHLLGVVSDGGVHGHQDHALALARIVTQAGIGVAVHAFTDGRDTGPMTAGALLPAFTANLPPGAALATMIGRYFAMDRDQRWDRVARAYLAMTEAKGAHFATATEAMLAAYGADISDEFFAPAIIGDFGGMKDGDVLLCFNFRADRVREILDALIDPHFNAFPRPRLVRFAAAAGMTRYSDNLAASMGAVFPPVKLHNILGEVVSVAGRKQLRMAETEKYPHVTYFLNGGKEAPYEGEHRIMVPSPKVATYDLQPQMSAPELTDKAVSAIARAEFDLIVLNFANPDMVGHTGNLQAAIEAVEAVDAGLGRIADAVRAQGGALLVTADHGNCEMMRDPETGGPHTAHTTNPVPVFLSALPGRTLRNGRLADLAPTLLDLMGLAKPLEMTGTSLISVAAEAAGNDSIHVNTSRDP